jgi:hypothetical protein
MISSVRRCANGTSAPDDRYAGRRPASQKYQSHEMHDAVGVPGWQWFLSPGKPRFNCRAQWSFSFGATNSGYDSTHDAGCTEILSGVFNRGLVEDLTAIRTRRADVLSPFTAYRFGRRCRACCCIRIRACSIPKCLIDSAGRG